MIDQQTRINKIDIFQGTTRLRECVCVCVMEVGGWGKKGQQLPV